MQIRKSKICPLQSANSKLQKILSFAIFDFI